MSVNLILGAQTLFLMMLKGLKELDKSIIRDPLTLTRTRPVSIPSQLFLTSSPLRYVASRLFKRPLRIYEAPHGRLVNER